MAQWCPRCGSEFVEGWGTCSNCGIELVDEPPSRTIDPTPEALISARPDPEEFVPIWEGPTPEASRLADLIQRAHIPVDLGEALQSGHARIEVPRAYVEDARDALALSTGADLSPIGPRADFDWTWVARIALIIVALLLVVLLVLPSL
ncbi:MAG: hypothetical protein ACRDKJ_13560 [Actinomycetota bacterium]